MTTDDILNRHGAPDFPGDFSMTRDFTLEKYEELARVLKENYRVVGVGECLAGAGARYDE